MPIALSGCDVDVQRIALDLPDFEFVTLREEHATDAHLFEAVLIDVRGRDPKVVHLWRKAGAAKILAACAGPDEAVAAVEAGALDVWVPPFTAQSLALRLRLLNAEPRKETWQMGDRVVDLKAGKVRHGDASKNLSTAEVAVLRLLLDNEGVSFTGERIQELVMGYSSTAQTRAAAQVFYRLRKKIEADPKEPLFLHSTYGVGFRFEPVETATAPGGNFPSEMMELVARTGEFDEIVHAAQTASFVSVLGPGGVGKTELARVTAMHLATHARLDAWFIDLRDCRDGAAVTHKVLSTMGLDENNGLEVLKHIPRRVIVLDNLEQLSADGLAAVTQVPSGPHVVLTTSRTDHEFGSYVVRLGELTVDESVVLFVKRARQARFGRPADVDRLQVAGLMSRIQRLPLAIELLAAQSRTRALPDLIGALNSVAVVDVHETHGELERVLQSSWETLSALAQRGLVTLTVFRGGFAEVDAVVVLGDHGDVVVAELASKSMLQVMGATRLQLPVPVVEFARARADGASLLQAQARHAAHFAQLWSARLLEAGPHDHEDAIPGMSAETGNLVVARDWAQVHGPRSLGNTLCVLADRAIAHASPMKERIAALGPLGDDQASIEVAIRRLHASWAHGDVREARACVQGLLAQELPRRQRAEVLLLSSLVEQRDSIQHGLAPLEEALALCTEDTPQRVGLLREYAVLCRMALRVPEARKALEDAKASNAPLADGARMQLEDALASFEGHYGDRERALEHSRIAKIYGERAGGRLRGVACFNLGNRYLSWGRTDDAVRELTEARNLARTLGDRVLEHRANMSLGAAALDAGQASVARTVATQTLGGGATGQRRVLAITLLALALRFLDRDDEARVWLEQARRDAATWGLVEVDMYVAVHHVSVLVAVDALDEAHQQLLASRAHYDGQVDVDGQEMVKLVSDELAAKKHPTVAWYQRCLMASIDRAAQSQSDEVRRLAILSRHVQARVGLAKG